MDETTPELQEYYAKMDRPMPGESLTEDPEAPQPYTSTTEFSVPQEAIDYIFDQMTQEENYSSIIESLMDGTTVMELTRLILFSGFNEGKFNPDLMVILIEPTAYLIMGLAERAGVEYTVMADDEEDMFGVTVDPLEMKEPSEEAQAALDMVEGADLPEAPTESLMARPPPPPPTEQPSLMQRI
tara:strand:- start:1535 stop:2086 length:552 start_codon:yes stop_codon:yes gene_type:complete